MLRRLSLEYQSRSPTITKMALDAAALTVSLSKKPSMITWGCCLWQVGATSESLGDKQIPNDQAAKVMCAVEVSPFSLRGAVIWSKSAGQTVERLGTPFLSHTNLQMPSAAEGTRGRGLFLK